MSFPRNTGMFVITGLLLAVFSPAVQAQAGQIGKLVIVGDSLSAGFQNFSLYDSDSAQGAPLGGQKHGYAALIAQQAGVNLNLPLITYPGVPPVFTTDASGHISRGTLIGMRENPLLQTLDLSVPGFTLADALARSINLTNVTNAIDLMAVDVLGFPGLALQTPPCGAIGFNGTVLTLSEVACALQQTPDTILVSIGNNDALQTLTLGIPPTDPLTFGGEYAKLLGTLASTHANIAVANIPDVTRLPFLMTAAAFQAKCHKPAQGAGFGDFVVANITSTTSNSGDICTNYVVRSGLQVLEVAASVRIYNVIIQALAQQYGAAIVDLNGLFAQLSQNGYNVGNKKLTTAFLGGLFSLDGIHPTNSGYAILANQFIQTMNSKFGFNIPQVSVAAVVATDPLVPSH